MKKKIKVKGLSNSPFLISEEEVIGEGSFGKVVKAYNSEDPSKQLVAKIIPVSSDHQESIETELKILRQIPTHPNLVNCLKLQISSERNVYLIMEYCNGGSFEKYIFKHPNLEEAKIWSFLRDFCRGYRVLYDSHLIHRDIKPDNILIHNGVVKIADFGFAKKVNHHRIVQNISSKGTPVYMAPELNFQEKGSSKVDVFSLGCVLFRLAFSGEYPFYSVNRQLGSIQEYFQHLAKTPLKFPKYPQRSDRLKQLISKMLIKDKDQRIEWAEIFSYPEIEIDKKDADPEIIPEQLEDIAKTMVLINRSSAHIQVVQEPFNLREHIQQEANSIVQFTQYASSIEIYFLRQFVFKAKIILSVIKHLNSKLQSMVHTQKLHDYVINHLKKIVKCGILYSLQLTKFLIHRICAKMPESLQSEMRIIQQLKKHQEELEEKKRENSIYRNYNQLEYQNSLYDFLTQFIEYPPKIKEIIKIPASFMIDLYDGCLKLGTMKSENQQIDLQDTLLDQIDFEHPEKYRHYMESKQQTTIPQIKKSLMMMGLLFL